VDQDNKPAAWRKGDEVWMVDAKITAIRKMKDKGPKWFGVAQLFDLFNCHKRTLKAVIWKSKRQKKNRWPFGQRVLQNSSSINVC
jgi:hypothetical protein